MRSVQSRYLGLTAAILLSLAGCAPSTQKRVRVDRALAAFVPNDSIMLAGVRMDEIRATPVYRKLLAQAGDRRFDEFAASTGFDPRKDVTSMLVASDGTKSVVIARGRFQLSGANGAQTRDYKGVRITGNDHGAFAVIGRDIALAGTPGSVHAAIDQYKNGGARAAILDRAEAITGESQVWAISSGWSDAFAHAIPQQGNAANLRRFLQSLEESTFTADLRTGLRADATGNCRTEQDAKVMTETLRGFVGLGRLNVPENQPELLRAFDGIHIEQQQKAVRVNVEIPQEALDKLLEMGRRVVGTSLRAF